ncbi:unnamed protein product [Symbiodinium sp. CCMP2592]|nr:unnamed protein product [Symbiodinium sp. CCMP2592]
MSGMVTEEGFEEPEQTGADDTAMPADVDVPGRGRGGRGRGGRGRGRGTKAAGKNQSAGRGGKKAAPVTTCICPNCTAPKYPGSRFCSLFHHKKAWDNLCYQRRTRSLTDEEKEAFDKGMANDGEAGKVVEQFATDNPPELKKKQLFDFAKFCRVTGQRLSKQVQKGNKPFTERAYYKYAENVLGLSTEEAEEEWKVYVANKTLRRDNEGHKGAERIWIPAHDLDVDTREHYVDNQVIEGSEDFKAPTDADRKMLQDHLRRQHLGFDDERFTFTAEQVADVASGVPPVTPKKKAGTDADKLLGETAEDTLTPEKVAAVNLTREPTQLHRAMDSSLRKIRREFKKVVPVALAAVKEYEQYPAPLRASDRALLSFWLETGLRCAGKPEDMCWMVPDSSVSSAGPSGHVPLGPAQSQPGTPNQAVSATASEGAADAVSSEFIEQRKLLSFEGFLAEPRTSKNKFWDGGVNVLRELDVVQDSMETLLECKEPQEFLKYKQEWLASEKAFLQLPKAIKQSADDLTKHMKLRIAEDSREKKRQLDQKAKDDLQRVRNEAKQQAEAIKKRKLDQQSVVAKIYTVDMPASMCAAVPTATSGSTPDFAKPWMMDCSTELVAVLGDPVVQKAIGTWGSQYKRTMAAAKISCATFPLDEKSGRGLVNDFAATLKPRGQQPDITPVSGGKQFTDSVWLYGLSPDHKTISFLPNHAPCVRVLAVGETRYILIEWSSLLAALEIKDDAPGLPECAINTLRGLDEPALEALPGKGIVWMQCTLKPQVALFIPTGWLVVEISGNCPLIYGFRKGFFTFLTKHVQKYEEAVFLQRACQQNVTRMEQILQILKDQGKPRADEPKPGQKANEA